MSRRYLFAFPLAVLGLGAIGASGVSDVYDQGIELWRTPDSQGRACASCHSSDGIELAAYGYDGATLVRRATPHLGAANAKKLSDYILALRAKLHLKGTLDPMRDRPMQPGGVVLPGASALDRDRAFALRLKDSLPLLEGARIQTQNQAKAALAQVLALDVTKLRIGIDMNRLSEDKFHGNEHASLAHWIPDEAPLPYSADLEKAQERYLEQPTEERLGDLDSIYARAWKKDLTTAQELALEKARSLLRLQHLLRTGNVVCVRQQIPDPRFAPSNPFWQIGDIARLYSNSQFETFALSPDVLANKSLGPSLKEQMRDMRLPWLWLGWTVDPGLQRTSYDRRVRFADWFSEFVFKDGPYPAHAALMLTKKVATEGYDKSSWASVTPQHLVINFSWILREDNWKLYVPKDPQYRVAASRFLANSFRMFALLQTEELKRTGKTYFRDPLIQQLTAMRDVVTHLEPASARQDTQLFNSTIRKVLEAQFVPT